MKFSLLSILLIFSTLGNVLAQEPEAKIVRPIRKNTPEQPRLIVGIVVDQMRYDFLYRYRYKYGQSGFNRFLREGFSCENTHFNYVPTYTGPGHAAIYSGTTPSMNGIISNDWFDPEWQKNRYVTEDKRFKTVGAPPGKSGQHSPAVMVSTTITDELRLSNNFRSKVVGVCLKDRGSILPAGHIPNACYWFDDDSGNWITSTYYADSLGLPQWAKQFNDQKFPAKYLSSDWKTLHPEETYTQSFPNWEKYEKRLKGNESGKFPYRLPIIKSAGESGFGLIRNTPFGNSLTLDFALAAIEGMELGQDSFPDFLCLSFSATDYCAHNFGIHAIETEDTYLRLDAELSRFFDALEQKFGKQNVLIFLTADHGGAETPAHLRDIRIPAGVLDESKLDTVLNSKIEKAFNQKGKFVHYVGTQQVWLNHSELEKQGIPQKDAERLIINHLQTLPGVYAAFSREELMDLPADFPFGAEIRRGLFPRRSGHVFFMLEPAWHPDDKYFKVAGTTHGSPYAYDSHVPLLWYGWKIRRGESFAPVSITDVAPTLAALLKIMEPNATTGKVIEDLMKK